MTHGRLKIDQPDLLDLLKPPPVSHQAPLLTVGRCKVGLTYWPLRETKIARATEAGKPLGTPVVHGMSRSPLLSGIESLSCAS